MPNFNLIYIEGRIEIHGVVPFATSRGIALNACNDFVVGVVAARHGDLNIVLRLGFCSIDWGGDRQMINRI